MREWLVEELCRRFHTTIFRFIVPDVGVVYALAITVCLVTFLRRVRQAGLSEYDAAGAALVAVVAGLIGARAWYLWAHFDVLARHPDELWQLGASTTSFGAYLGGGAAFGVFLLLAKIDARPYLDVVGSCLGLGPFIGRWACFLNGDDFGRPTHLPWGISFPPGSYPFADHVNRGWVNLSASQSLRVHPFQLYLSANGLVLFGICSWVWRRHLLRPGGLFALYWQLYGVIRFWLEVYRGGDVVRLWGFSSSQVVCLGIVVVATLAQCLMSRRTESQGSDARPSDGTRQLVVEHV